MSLSKADQAKAMLAWILAEAAQGHVPTLEDVEKAVDLIIEAAVKEARKVIESERGAGNKEHDARGMA